MAQDWFASDCMGGDPLPGPSMSETSELSSGEPSESSMWAMRGGGGGGHGGGGGGRGGGGRGWGGWGHGRGRGGWGGWGWGGGGGGGVGWGNLWWPYNYSYAMPVYNVYDADSAPVPVVSDTTVNVQLNPATVRPSNNDPLVSAAGTYCPPNALFDGSRQFCLCPNIGSSQTVKQPAAKTMAEYRATAWDTSCFANPSA